MHQIDYTWYEFQSPELPFPLPILGFRRAVDVAAYRWPSELLEGIEYDTAYGLQGQWFFAGTIVQRSGAPSNTDSTDCSPSIQPRCADSWQAIEYSSIAVQRFTLTVDPSPCLDISHLDMRKSSDFACSLVGHVALSGMRSGPFTLAKRTCEISPRRGVDPDTNADAIPNRKPRPIILSSRCRGDTDR